MYYRYTFRWCILWRLVNLPSSLCQQIHHLLVFKVLGKVQRSAYCQKAVFRGFLNCISFLFQLPLSASWNPLSSTLAPCLSNTLAASNWKLKWFNISRSILWCRTTISMLSCSISKRGENIQNGTIIDLIFCCCVMQWGHPATETAGISWVKREI